MSEASDLYPLCASIVLGTQYVLSKSVWLVGLVN